MSLPLIKTEIARFLASEDAEILCIKGRWGVGKTYAWNTLLGEAQIKTNGIAFKNYSYVSLFGRNSLTDLRNSIVENTINTDDLLKKPDLDTYSKFLKAQEGIKKAGGLLEKLSRNSGSFASLIGPIGGYAQIAQRLLYLSVKKTIVCLDDLERAGTGLSMRDILGLVAQLKDEKSCKVVILLNDEKLSEASKEDFTRQLEKVVDVVIDFTISPEEAGDIALDKNGYFYNYLRENCIKLKIDNIRVIRKAEKFCSRMTHLVTPYDNRIRERAAYIAALACYAKFQPDQAPSLSDIRKYNVWDRIAKGASGETQEQPSYMDVLSDYDFQKIDKFDEVILAGVERGFLNEDKFKGEAEKLVKEFAESDMSTSYRKAFKIFRSSFSKNDHELMKVLSDAVRQNLPVIGILNLNEVTTVLRSIDCENEASRLIAEYMQFNKNNPERMRYDTQTLHNGKLDPEIRAAIDAYTASSQVQIDPFERLIKLGRGSGWNREGEIALSKLSVGAITDRLRITIGDELENMLSGVQRLFSIGNLSQEMLDFRNKAKLSLAIISRDSKLNRARVVNMFGDDFVDN